MRLAHAQIRATDGRTLTDLGSTNGTRLNGQTVQTRELADGDRITIGSTVLEFRRDEEPPPAWRRDPFALSALKYGLFALLFLFVWRSMRWAVRGLTVVEPAPSGRKAAKEERRRRPARQPVRAAVVVQLHSGGQGADRASRPRA